MDHSDFEIGEEFTCGGRTWRCTDKGTRVIVAICLDGDEGPGEELWAGTLSREDAERGRWFCGPPYAVAETVFDEDDMRACEPLPPRRHSAA